MDKMTFSWRCWASICLPYSLTVCRLLIYLQHATTTSSRGPSSIFVTEQPDVWVFDILMFIHDPLVCIWYTKEEESPVSPAYNMHLTQCVWPQMIHCCVMFLSTDKSFFTMCFMDKRSLVISIQLRYPVLIIHFWWSAHEDVAETIEGREIMAWDSFCKTTLYHPSREPKMKKCSVAVKWKRKE